MTPSISQEFSSRRTICSSYQGETMSPMTMLITSLRLIRPTTRLYSLTIRAKVSPAWRNCLSTSARVSRSGTTSGLRIRVGSSREIGWSLSTRWNRSLMVT
ncbi:hypothetical protein D3C72_1890460 [compost metagenome]